MKKRMVFILFTVMAIASVAVCLYAWAKYVTVGSENSSQNIAKWNFDMKLKNGPSGSETAGPIDLAETLDYNYVASGRIAPGTSGEFQIVVNTYGTETSLRYDVSIPISNCPRNITFTRVDENNTETVLSEGGAENTLTRTLTFSKFIHLNNVNNNNGKHIEKIRWDWPYELTTQGASDEDKLNYDLRDVSDNGLNASMMIVVTGTQVYEDTTAQQGGTNVEPVVTTRDIGDTVEYSTSLNGVTLNNWKVFYVDGDYTYLIYGDYLPTTAINTSTMTGIDKGGDYAIMGFESDEDYGLQGKLDYIDSLGASSGYWDDLLVGTINGHNVNESRTANVWAMGTPTLQLWVDSWNEKYPDNALYYSYSEYEPGNGGYGVSFVNDNAQHVGGEFEFGDIEGTSDTLYFPHQDYYPNGDGGYIQGYWLATSSSWGDSYELTIKCIGGIDADGNGSEAETIRPIIKLPSSVLN